VALVRDGAGNLYGTTGWGGTSGIGVIFAVRPWGRRERQESTGHGWEDSSRSEWRVRYGELVNAVENFMPAHGVPHSFGAAGARW